MAKNTSQHRRVPNNKSNDLLPYWVRPDSPIQKEYVEHQQLFDAQPASVKHFVEAQARKLAEASRRNQLQTTFMLPDKVVAEIPAEGKGIPVAVPEEMRAQVVGSVINRLTRADMRTILRQRLNELEDHVDGAVIASARLLRYATSSHMVYNMLPAGRSVTYRAAEGEEIPTIPTGKDAQPESAITQASDAIVEEEEGEAEAKRGQLQVPFVPAARRFYLPQWVAFDDDGKMLVHSIGEAEAHLASMQSYLAVLHAAVGLAPFMVADPEYQRKRYGMLGQLINQGRALARHETQEMIDIIRQRAAAHDLNRGLSLSVPYFDDQSLEMRTHDFEVIPGGRIMFVPTFVVRAAREEQAKVAQDTRLSPSTRQYLLKELQALSSAFEKPARL
jgi:hypothetical protein